MFKLPELQWNPKLNKPQAQGTRETSNAGVPYYVLVKNRRESVGKGSDLPGSESASWAQRQPEVLSVFSCVFSQ
jgi:hypothetical protein